jgi:hypothetical protein
MPRPNGDIVVSWRRRQLRTKGSFEIFSVCEKSSKCLHHVPADKGNRFPSGVGPHTAYTKVQLPKKAFQINW